MPIYATYEPKKYTVAPEGLFPAVCVDVVDMGMRRNKLSGKDQHKCRIAWQLEEKDPETGFRYVVSGFYTLSLNPKSTLSGILEAWRGKPFTDAERTKFDVEKLIGKPCQVQIVHRAGMEGQVFCNVQAVVPLGKGMTAPRADENYVRVKDRAPDTIASAFGYDATGKKVEDENGKPVEEEDRVPF